eukprot:TRINITY_DN443_c0_g1_i3.p1 TRINITY_DN443_c0_g1~~TRINITY_DN443_c0_g1_i3.p1  ORF type:complete len:1151 (-),score=293.09 TRINITY_DN443_c0_g1_i3:86-3097(-)
MDWRSGMKPEHMFHNRLPTGEPAREIAPNVVFIPAKEVNVFDVASSAKIDFILLPHGSQDDLQKRTTLDDTQPTNIFAWNYDPAKNGSAGLLQSGTSFKCIDCYVYSRFSIIFNLDYGVVSMNPIPKLNSLKVSYEGDLYGKYAVVLGPAPIQAFNAPAMVPTTIFSTITVGTFPVTFSGNLGIQFVAPAVSGFNLRANNSFQASAKIGYQYTSNGTAINSYTPSNQYSSPRFNISSPVPGTFEVHVIPGLIAKFPSSTVNFDMTYQFDPWVGIDLYPKNESLCSAGGSAYSVSSGYKMTVTSGGMTYQGTYIMPKIGPISIPGQDKKAADCSFCRGCTTPSSSPGSIQASARKRNSLLRADENSEYSTWYKVATSSSPVQITLKGNAFKDPEEIENVIIYVEDDSDSVNVQVYADQGRKPTPDNFKWAGTNKTASQELVIPVTELDSTMNLNVAFTSDQPTTSNFIVYLDIRIGERYGKVFRMGDLPDSGINSISFESDSSGPALGGFVVVVEADTGAPDAQITTNTTEDDVWWQGGNDGTYQNIWVYRWQVNDDPDWSWEDEYIDDDIVEYSGYVSVNEPSTNISVMVAPFVEITLLNWYSFLEAKTLRFYFLTAVDPEVDELWIQYDNSEGESDLLVSHKAFNLDDEIPMRKSGDLVAKGDVKDFKFKKGKLDENDYNLGTVYSADGKIAAEVAVFFIYPLTSGIPEVENDVNATFSIFRFDLVDPVQFPGRGAKCSTFFTERPLNVSMLLNFENLQSFETDAFTTSDGGQTWDYFIRPEHTSPAYIYLEAVNGSSFSVVCTHVIPLPSETFEIEVESLSTIIFDVAGVEDRYVKFPASSVIHLHPTTDENVFLRPVDRDVSISKGFSYISFFSTVADLDARGRTIEIQPFIEDVDVKFKVRDNLMNVSLSNYQYQWDYDLLVKDLGTTLRTFQGGVNWDNYVARVLEAPATYLLNNTNNQRLCFDISILKRPTKLTITVPQQWTIPPLPSEESASKKIK